MPALDTRPKPLADVLRWKRPVEISSARWGIPTAVLFGLIHEESGGKEGLTSSAGAKGLTQFMPPAAATYNVNVNPGHADSQIDGAAHYLHDLGFSQNPRKALASYAAGPGNVSAGYFYADNVLGHLAPIYGDPKAPASAAVSNTTTTAGDPTTSSSGDAFLTGEKKNQALYALLWLAALGAGVIAITYGVSRSTGVRNPLHKLPVVPG